MWREADESNGRREDATSSRWARISGLQVGDVRAQTGGGVEEARHIFERRSLPAERLEAQLSPDGSLYH